MKPAIEKRVIEHGNKLNAIFNTGIEPLKLCRALRRLENEAHKLAEDACNWLSMESPEFDERYQKIVKKLADILLLYTQGERLHSEHERFMKKFGIFINLDPRGYALKIDDQYVREHNLDIYKDFGGYGILAPDLS